MARVLDGQADVRAAQPTGVAVGVTLMAAPDVFGYSDALAGDLHHTLGPMAASLAIIAVWEATRALRWANLAVAVALLLGTVFADHTPMGTAVGVTAALLLGGTTPFGGSARHKFAGGWTGLLPLQRPQDRRDNT